MIMTIGYNLIDILFKAPVDFSYEFRSLYKLIG